MCSSRRSSAGNDSPETIDAGRMSVKHCYVEMIMATRYRYKNPLATG